MSVKSPETAVHGTTASFTTILLSVRFHIHTSSPSPSSPDGVISKSSFVNVHTTVSHTAILNIDHESVVAFQVQVSEVC